MGTKSSTFQKAISEASKGNKKLAAELLQSLLNAGSDTGTALNETETKLIDLICEKYNLTVSAAHVAEKETLSTVNNQSEGISLITCSMNRTENLIIALPSWLALREIDEIIIVDWSSKIEVKGELEQAGIHDSRIKIIRADDEPRWVLSYAFNLGFRNAGKDKILKVDADITLEPNFFEANDLKAGTVVAGNWELADAGQEHINGFFYTHTNYLMMINGFNEYITTYGWDDDDIYERLNGVGVKRVSVDTSTIYHLPHDDTQRLGNGEADMSNALQELKKDPLFSIRANRYRAFVMPPWNQERAFAPFEEMSREGNYLRVRRKKNLMPHIVSDDIKKEAEIHAAREILSWRAGAIVFHLSNEQFFHLITNHKLEDIKREDVEAVLKKKTSPVPQDIGVSTQKKIFIDAQHGLGNRLRAIASGAAIAEKTDRELVVVWEPDHHCECELSDLFEYEGSVLNKSFIKDASPSDIDVYNYMESEKNAEKDRLIHVGDKDIYVRTAFIANCPHTNWDDENRFLKSLKPVRVVRDLIMPFNLENHIAAHIRMEGGAGLDIHAYEKAENWTEKDQELLNYWREKSNYRHFLKHIDKIFEDEPQTKLFLATDMAETYELFERYYGDRMIYLKREAFDRSKEQLIYALADAILLSKCKRLLGSTWSSFSEMAMRFTNGYSSIEMSGEDF